MILQKIENGLPEQEPINEQKADDISVSPSIRQCSVSGSVSVVHCKKAKYDVYIGRPSKWGNPFTNRPGTKAEFILPTRAEAINAYRKWITEGEGKHLLKDLHELKGKTLGCWCKPQSCHGDVLAELVELYCQ